MPSIRTIVVTGISGTDTTQAIGLLGGSSYLAKLRQFLPAMLDLSVCELDNGERVVLFGVPPTACAEVVRAAKPMGLIVLVDGSRPHPVRDLLVCLDACGDARALPAISVGVYGEADKSLTRLGSLQSALISRHLAGPVLLVDLQRRGDLYMLIDSVLVQACP